MGEMVFLFNMEAIIIKTMDGITKAIRNNVILYKVVFIIQVLLEDVVCIYKSIYLV